MKHLITSVSDIVAEFKSFLLDFDHKCHRCRNVVKQGGISDDHLTVHHIINDEQISPVEKTHSTPTKEVPEEALDISVLSLESHMSQCGAHSLNC